MGKLSFIVPVYNVEGYLPECIDSLRSQTYRDIEIVCVDDGSKDRSGDLLELYAEVEPRLKVIHKANGGLSSARNAGIAAATGDYVSFVDSDDFIEKDAAAKIVAALEDCDVATFGGRCYPKHLGHPWIEYDLSPRDVYYAAFDPRVLFDERSHPYAWRTACRRTFLNEHGIRFDESVRFGEDQIFHFAVYPRAHGIRLISDKLYNYRVKRADSLMDERSHNEVLKLHELIKVVEHILTDWSKGGFLERYSREIFDWTCQFLLCHVLATDTASCSFLCNYLQAVWTTFFDERQLRSYLDNLTYGAMANAVLFERDKAYGKKCKRIFYSYTLKTEGVKGLARRAMSRILGIGPLGALRGAMRRVLPASGPQVAARLDDIAWRVDDARKHAQALSMLNVEVSLHRRARSGR